MKNEALPFKGREKQDAGTGWNRDLQKVRQTNCHFQSIEDQPGLQREVHRVRDQELLQGG